MMPPELIAKWRSFGTRSAKMNETRPQKRRPNAQKKAQTKKIFSVNQKQPRENEFRRKKIAEKCFHFFGPSAPKKNLQNSKHSTRK